MACVVGLERADDAIAAGGEIDAYPTESAIGERTDRHLQRLEFDFKTHAQVIQRLLVALRPERDSPMRRLIGCA
jgi:hypothetical protein